MFITWPITRISTNGSQIDELNEKAGREAFGFCLDTGHMLLVGKRFETFVPILGSRLKTLHLHDNDGVLDRHLAPFAGQLNWEDFINSMRDVGYKGDLSFETCAQIAKSLLCDAAAEAGAPRSGAVAGERKEQ